MWEWTEDWRGLGDGKCWRCNIPTKGLRGGSFNYINVGLIATNIDPGSPQDHYFICGGRVARRLDMGTSRAGWCTPPAAWHVVATQLQRALTKAVVAGAATLFILLLIWMIATRRSMLRPQR